MRGIATVAQEVGVVPQLRVAQNVFLGVDRAARASSRAARCALNERARGDRRPAPAGPRRRGASLAEQQKVEILRALARDAELIVMDEPTASLGAEETAQLHEIVRSLAGAGRTVLLVSHFLREVLALADEVTVLRDGRS